MERAGLLEKPTPLWLSHHRSDTTDRCHQVGRFHVCRRCSVLYPLAFVVAALHVLGWWLPAETDVWIMWLLAVPVTIEWVGEHLGGWTYSPTRQVVLTTLSAPALGVGLAIHIADPFAPAAVVPMLVFGTICFVSAMVGSAANRHAHGVARVWEETFEDAEKRRLDRLTALVGEVEIPDPNDAVSNAGR